MKISLTLFLATFVANTSAFSHLMANSYVRAIAHDARRLCIATDMGLVVKDKTTGFMTLYNHDNRLHADGVASVALQGDTIWIGQDANWAATIVGDAVHTFQVDLPGHDLPPYASPINSIATGTNGYVYYSLMDNFIVQKDGETQAVYNIPTHYLESRITQMKYDSQGLLWITSCGNVPESVLCKYTHADGLVFIPETYGISGIPASYCLAIDHNNCLWFAGSGSNITMFDGERVTTIPTSQSWQSWQWVFTELAFDDNQMLWALLSNGKLLRYNEETFTEYVMELRENETTTCLDIDGDTIYIGTTHRLLSFVDGTFAEASLQTEGQGIKRPLADAPSTTLYCDLQGRRLAGRQEKCVYIEGGKKIVEKRHRRDIP